MNQLMERVNRLEERMNGLDDSKDDFVYEYLSREKVNAVFTLCENDLEEFVLDLARKIPGDWMYYSQPRYSLNYREVYFSRVGFIKKCVFKYYKVPEHLRKIVWKPLKNVWISSYRKG
ncbi:hypothetical protein OSTOST_06708 [Ostertagia ostertagi]